MNLSGTIDYRKLKSGGYQLLEDTSIVTGITGCAARIGNLLDLDQFGKLTVRKGYQWDGCSGPAIDRKANMRAGLFHDALYQLLRARKLGQALRIDADKIFRDVYIFDGGYRWLAAIDYAGLRGFAGYAAKPQPEVETKRYTAGRAA